MPYVDVAPVARLPRGLEEFTYAAPDGMRAPPGSLVVVNFNGRQMPGIVMSEAHPPLAQKIKPIERVVAHALWSAADLVALRRTAAGMLTTLPRLIFYLIPEIPSTWPVVSGDVAHQAEGHAIKLIRSMDDHATFMRVTRTIQGALKKKKTVLVLVARQSECESVAARLGSSLRDASIQSYTAEKKSASGFASWIGLAQGAEVLVTTRAGAFAPAKNLGLIVVMHEELDDFKDWGRDPYVDARVLAEARARALGIPLLITSRAPRISTYANHHLSKTKLPIATIIDLNHAGGTKESRVLTEPLVRTIEQTLDNGKHVVLLVHRRGEGGVLLCRDCGRPVLCPRCSGPLIPHGPHLECHRCESKQTMPLFCPACRGPRLASFGYGTRRLQPLIQERWADTPVIVVDKNTQGRPMIPKTPTIVVGTTRILTDGRRSLESSRIPIGLLGILQGDGFLAANDFRAEERAYAQIREFQSLGAPLVVQTYSPNHRIFQALVAAHDDLLYASWIEERKKWRYPPFVNLVSLTRTGSHDMMTAVAAGELDALRSDLGDTAEVTDLIPWPYAIRGTRRWTALVKIPLDHPLPKSILGLSPAWRIEVNPQKLFSV